VQGAIIYTWTGAIPGRELDSKAVMEASDAFYDQLMAEGRITGHDWYLSTQGGHNLMIVRGEMDALASILADPDLMDLNTKAGIAMEHLTWALYATGDSVPHMAETYFETAALL